MKTNKYIIIIITVFIVYYVYSYNTYFDSKSAMENRTNFFFLADIKI